MVDVVVLHIDDCPNWIEAGRRLTAALGATGHEDDDVTFVLVENPVRAEQMHFAGSPTILVDGLDLFPDGVPTNDFACRVYRTPSGLAGLPTTTQMVEALVARRSDN